MGVGFKTVKYMLFFYNFAFGLCGFVLMTAAAFCYSNTDLLQFAVKDLNFTVIPNVLLALATIIFFVAFYGCFSAIRESYCMVVTFTVLLLVILIAHITTGIVIFVTTDTVIETVTSTLKSMFDKSRNVEEAMRGDVRDIQYYLRCCGLDGPDYWGEPPPESCTRERFQSGVYAKYTLQTGCLEIINGVIKLHSAIASPVMIAVGAVEIIGVVFALWLVYSIRNREVRGGV